MKARDTPWGTNTRLWEICKEIYREMYRRSYPRADFDELVAKQATLKKDWFMGYYLSVEQQEIIIFSVCKRHGLTKRERYIVAKEVQLGCAPNSSRESWRDYRKTVRKNG